MVNNNQANPAADAAYPYIVPPMKTRRKLVYMAGNVGTDLINSVINANLLFFYTNVFGISAAVAAIILLGSRIFDAFTDIFMGWIVDRTRTRWGKARPWLLWMALPYAVAGTLIFFAPFSANPAVDVVAKVILSLAMYNIAGTIFGTAVSVPANTLASIATDNPNDRAQIGIFRILGTLIAGIIGGVVFLPMVTAIGGSDTSSFGWIMAMSVCGAIVCAALLFTFFFTKEKLGAGSTVEKAEAVPLKKALPALARNKNWILIIFISLIVQLVGGALTARPYLAKYLLGNINYASVMNIAYMIPMVLSMLFIPLLIKKLGKVKTAIIGVGVSICAYLLQGMFPYSLIMAILSAVLRGPGFALVSAPMMSLMGDIIDHEEWRSGIRAEGVANSAFSFASKCGSGLAAAVIGWILTIGAFDATLEVQTKGAETAIIIASVWFPLVLFVISFFLLLFFNIDKIHPRVVKELKDRRDNYISKLKFTEKIPSTPEKRDARLKFARFIPKGIMEKAMRKNLEKLRAAPLNGGVANSRIKTAEYKISGYNGEIKLRLYVPEVEKSSRPLMIFFHGGGFMGGSIDATNNYCAAYAERTDEAVISVDYHLAPEYPFPHGLEDCYKACKWAHDNADTLKVDVEKITLSGDSAGGNFAAVITRLSSERREFKVHELILLYPYTTFGSPQLPMTKIMHKWYLNGAERKNPGISPMEGNLEGYPRTFTVVCEYDLLAESGKDFAEELSRRGVDSTCVMFMKTRHAFLDQAGTLKQTEELLDLIDEWKNPLPASGQ